MIYQIVWTGASLPSKKNSKQIWKDRKTDKLRIASSDKYLEWEELFVMEILSLRYRLGKVNSASYTFFAPNRRKFDLSNKVESINDALVKAKFLDDDDYEHIPRLILIFGGVEEEWRVVMEFDK